jgi:homoserine kinase type II
MGNASKHGQIKKVYGLWFVWERKESQDIELLIGMYATELEAKRAIDRLARKPGFVDFPGGFQIHTYELGREGWVDGFVEEPNTGRVADP